MSLVPALQDATATPREAALTQFADGYSLRTPRYRYTEWGEDGKLGAELYDHQTDPKEMKNLSGSKEHAKIVEELSQQIRKRIKQAQTTPDGLIQIQFDNRRRVR